MLSDIIKNFKESATEIIPSALFYTMFIGILVGGIVSLAGSIYLMIEVSLIGGLVLLAFTVFLFCMFAAIGDKYDFWD